MITPLKSNDELDRNGVEKLIEHILGGGVHGLFLLGTNGEGPSLSYRLRKEFLKLSCEIIRGRVPVLVGVTDSSFSGAMEMANYSKSVGVDSIVVAPPFYFPATESEMINYVEKLAAASPLPFVLYNMPMHTKINLTIQTIQRAKELGCIGVKDSSGDMANLYMMIDAFKEDQNFAVFAGTELYLPDAVMGGAHGAVAGGARSGIARGTVLLSCVATLAQELQSAHRGGGESGLHRPHRLGKKHLATPAAQHLRPGRGRGVGGWRGRGANRSLEPAPADRLCAAGRHPLSRQHQGKHPAVQPGG